MHTLRLLILPLSLLLTSQAQAGNDKHHKAASTLPSATASAKDEPWLNVRIVETEQDIIRRYYAQHPHKAADANDHKKKALPPGLRKKLERGGELPPGWQKKVARGEVLDPAVYGKAQKLPPELLKALPPSTDGVKTVIIEGKIVRLWEATRTILDVLDL